MLEETQYFKHTCQSNRSLSKVKDYDIIDWFSGVSNIWNINSAYYNVNVWFYAFLIWSND